MCSTASPLTVSTTPVNLIPFIPDNSMELFINCEVDGDDVDIYNPIWYSFTASATTVAIVSTFDGKYDVDYDINTVIAVYSGTCYSLTCLAFDDNGAIGSTLKSYLEFPVTINQQYFIAVGGEDDDEIGSFELSIYLAQCAN